jgi:hypothetical protein
MFEHTTACPGCGTTHAAAGILGALLNDLRTVRPDDPSWGVALCPACGQVTGVWDDTEGWGFGTRPAEIVWDPAPVEQGLVFAP